jgi:hypothetical protein
VGTTFLDWCRKGKAAHALIKRLTTGLRGLVLPIASQCTLEQVPAVNVTLLAPAARVNGAQLTVGCSPIGLHDLGIVASLCRWLNNNVSCPVCRKPLDDDDSRPPPGEDGRRGHPPPPGSCPSQDDAGAAGRRNGDLLQYPQYISDDMVHDWAHQAEQAREAADVRPITVFTPVCVRVVLLRAHVFAPVQWCSCNHCSASQVMCRGICVHEINEDGVVPRLVPFEQPQMPVAAFC